MAPWGSFGNIPSIGVFRHSLPLLRWLRPRLGLVPVPVPVANLVRRHIGILVLETLGRLGTKTPLQRYTLKPTRRLSAPWAVARA